jgi:tetraacyldisaccharide 4'-kinase
LAAKPLLVARLEPEGPPPTGTQLGFAGIAKPWKFERALRAAGCELVDFAPLADHAAIAERTLRFLAARAEALGAGLVTTEKDGARLTPTWRKRVAVWRVGVGFENEGALKALLSQAWAPR